MEKGKSLRVEWQYLSTKNDQGSFANLMVEYWATKQLSIAVGDMVNVDPHRYERMIIANKVLHYPTVFMGYTEKNTVFTLAYLKRRESARFQMILVLRTWDS